jgi:hypothetical protein
VENQADLNNSPAGRISQFNKGLRSEAMLLFTAVKRLMVKIVKMRAANDLPVVK